MMENGARKLVTARVQPGYINCTSQGRLPGCLFKFDDPGAQCRTGRDGILYMCNEANVYHLKSTPLRQKSNCMLVLFFCSFF